MHEILDIVKLLLNIWRLGRERQDNRSGFVGPKVDCCAPLIPFLRRLETVETDESENDDILQLFQECSLLKIEISEFLKIDLGSY